MSSERILNFLVNDILDFAQMRAGKFRKSTQTFNVSDSVQEVVDVLGFKAQNMNIDVQTEYTNFNRKTLEDYNTD